MDALELAKRELQWYEKQQMGNTAFAVVCRALVRREEGAAVKIRDIESCDLCGNCDNPIFVQQNYCDSCGTRLIWPTPHGKDCASWTRKKQCELCQYEEQNGISTGFCRDCPRADCDCFKAALEAPHA